MRPLRPPAPPLCRGALALSWRGIPGIREPVCNQCAQGGAGLSRRQARRHHCVSVPSVARLLPSVSECVLWRVALYFEVSLTAKHILSLLETRSALSSTPSLPHPRSLCLRLLLNASAPVHLTACLCCVLPIPPRWPTPGYPYPPQHQHAATRTLSISQHTLCAQRRVTAVPRAHAARVGCSHRCAGDGQCVGSRRRPRARAAHICSWQGARGRRGGRRRVDVFFGYVTG